MGRTIPANSTAHGFYAVSVNDAGEFLQTDEWSVWIDTMQPAGYELEAPVFADRAYESAVAKFDPGDRIVAVARWAIPVPEGLFVDAHDEYTGEGTRINQGLHISDFFWDLTLVNRWDDRNLRIIEENAANFQWRKKQGEAWRGNRKTPASPSGSTTSTPILR